MKNFCIFIFRIFGIFVLFLSAKVEAKSDKIIFQHIPKSGGVTVSSLLMNEYKYDQIFNSNMKNIKLFAYGLHMSLFEIEKMININSFKYITFMRNPIDRILSEHRYCIEKHKGNPQILISHKLPPNGDPIETASNVVCKMLSGLNDQDSSIPIEIHLIYAKKVLAEKLFFIGITEKIGESIHLLYSRLGWKIPEKIPLFNMTNNNHFSEEVLKGIAERNWADIELYEYALALYDLQKNQIVSSQNVPIDWIPNFVSDSHYTFDQELDGYGWGVREMNGEPQLRWAADNNEAGINFYLKSGTDYTIQCKILIQPVFYPRLKILVNGIPICLHSNISTNSKSTDYEWVHCNGIIPRNLLKEKSSTTFIFKMPPPEDPFLRQFYEEDQQQQKIDINYNRGKFACREIILLGHH